VGNTDHAKIDQLGACCLQSLDQARHEVNIIADIVLLMDS
jgi:hypothetical protein